MARARRPDPTDTVAVHVKGTRVGFVVPKVVTGSAMVLAGEQMVTVSMTFELVGTDMDARYRCTTVTLSEPTLDIDKGTWLLVRLDELRSRFLNGATDIVTVADRDPEDPDDTGMTWTVRETDLDDDDLTETEVVALCWLRATLENGDPNVLIQEFFGGGREAAKQRLFRVRRHGIVPPATPGQRKAKP